MGLIPLLLSGCYLRSRGDSYLGESNTLVLNAGFSYIYDWDDGNAFAAELLFDGGYYHFDEELKFDEPIVAGDQLAITFKNIENHVCVETFPANCTVKGAIESYSLRKSDIIEVKKDGQPINSFLDELRRTYNFGDNENVILDEKMNCTPLHKYEGDVLYLSYDIKRREDNCTCPAGAICDPCNPNYIAGLYAYNPRPDSLIN